MRRLTWSLLLFPLLAAAPPKLTDDEKIVHALSRLTWGARPGDVEAVKSKGLNRWTDEQLNPARIAENEELIERLEPLESLRMSPKELAQAYPPPAQGSTESRRNAMKLASDLQQAKVYRALYSNRQLEDVLAGFWFNHFNVFLNKGRNRFLVTSYERDAIRPHVLGRFRDLLVATAQHPAMLWYLDNWRSRDGRLNENYARELLELHTLGVDGGYTQKDVTEVARCFTGWTMTGAAQGHEFAFRNRLHDQGEKVVLGLRIAAGGGREDAIKVLDLVARHPSTARFLSTKLAQHFVADAPPEALVKAMAHTFAKSDGDLKAVLKTMLASKEFWSPQVYRAKLKSPFEMVVSALRASDARVISGFVVARKVAELGQPLYRKLEPTGYSASAEEWLNSAGLLARMNFATALTRNELRGVRLSSDPTALPNFGAPEFQRR